MQTSLWILFNTQRFYQQLSYLIIWYLIILTADQGQENKENERGIFLKKKYYPV